MYDKDYYKNKSVLVTGADGFVGSHLTEKLVELGADVSIFVRATSVTGTHKHSMRNIPHLQNKVKIVSGDIASEDTGMLINELSPQVIFHLAATAYVPYSFSHPVETFNVNALGSLHILEALRVNNSIERLVVTSTSEVYGTAQYAPIDENHPLNPAHPYGASKVAADRLAYSYWNTYDLPIAIIRPFNMYGPRHTYDVIPKFITLALNGEPITIHGDGTQTRDFLYVSDAVNAFLIMGYHNSAIGKTVNFGTGSDVSVNEIATIIKETSESHSDIIHIDGRTSEVDRLVADISLAKQLFNWKTNVTISEGIKKNIDFERNS